MFGIVISGQLTAGVSPLKGYIAGILGLMIAMIGADGIHAHVRFTLGFDAVNGGIGLIPATKEAAQMTESYAEGGPLAVFFDLSAEQALVRPVSPGYVVAAKVFEKALSDIANGADVADTLDAAVDEIDDDIEANQGYGH